MALTSEAKQLLSSTIRGLRERLLADIRAEANGRYQLSVSLKEAKLDEAHRRRRERLEAWLDEQVRATKPKSKKDEGGLRERFLRQAEKEAAATLVNRLVLLRLLEAAGLAKPAVVTGGWGSKGYREFREFAPGLIGDETEGYATLLHLVFDDLAVDLPGLFGNVGLTRLFRIPPSTLREVVEKLDQPALASAWTDDTTLGWVYQYWNDPEREALDAKIDDGGKIEPQEIAAKTQLFTERYVVEWLLQNSLGFTWLSMCKKHGWTPDAGPVLSILEERRAEWRKKREAGHVSLDDLMPIQNELEERWKYYVPQPIPEDAATAAPESVRSLRLLDPACGSGHFLVIAFDLLVALYREEALHLNTTITNRDIAESIVENNLHGIDIDPRAIQIAAAGLYLKAKILSREASPAQINLVAPVLKLATLPDSDPALITLLQQVEAATGIGETLTRQLLRTLYGVDHLGSLIKVDTALNEAIVAHESALRPGAQLVLGSTPAPRYRARDSDRIRQVLIGKLESFLAQHSGAADLGLRLDGEQLAAGVRFVRVAKEGTYDIVVGNPPYSDVSLLSEQADLKRLYPRGRANLYAAFLERAMEFLKQNGISALLVMRGWMFQCEASLASLRHFMLNTSELRLIGDVDRGAFDEIRDDQVAAAMVVFRKAPPGGSPCVALQPTPPSDRTRDAGRTPRKRAAVLAQVGRCDFSPADAKAIDGSPLVYWWSKDFIERYRQAPKLGRVAPVRQGMATTDNPRFVRKPWEVRVGHLLVARYGAASALGKASLPRWVPLVKGAAGACWFESLDDAVCWEHNGLEVKVCNEHGYGSFSRNVKNEAFYFRQGVAFSMIGNAFLARAHRYQSIIADMGSSAFPDNVPEAVCLMNAAVTREVLSALNPTLHFLVGDVNRLPMFTVPNATDIYEVLDRAFREHEAAREPSVEYTAPGPSSWAAAQLWAQQAVDRRACDALPPLKLQREPPSSESHISFAIGVALGRFGPSGEGVLEVPLGAALKNGILFVSTTDADSLDDHACAPIRAAWEEHGGVTLETGGLKAYLCKRYFEFHKKLYEHRPIYFPLSSTKKNFVAFVSIHRWADDTLNVVLADHLVPAKRRLEGELDDLRAAKTSGSDKGKADKRFTEVQKLLEELNDFIGRVTEVAEKGPPPPDDKTTRREVDARYVMDLDDGVMVNSAALWPLLEPQWKDPKKWWKELANAQGKKDYDWSHLAARYFPVRVRKKCHDDPSLAVAHKCFWELHPEKAYAWELRLQDEIRPDFSIDEPGSDAARAAFLKTNGQRAKDILAAEVKRRGRKAAKAERDDESNGPLFDGEGDAENEAEAANG